MTASASETTRQARAPRFDRRTEAHQRTSLRAELHAITDALIDALPTLERMAADMGRGIPSRGAGGSGGDVVLTSVEAAAQSNRDPGSESAEWLAEFHELLGHARRLDRSARGLLPLEPEVVEKLQERQNTVDVCAECGDPAPKVKRLDGHPYHPGACWMRAYRRIRGGAAPG